MPDQPDLFSPRALNQVSSSGSLVTTSNQAKLRAYLAVKGWQTRAQICEHFGWSPRTLRDLAESLGTDIVRSQAGFKLTDQITREDLEQVKMSIDSFLSQGKHMIDYSLALRKRLHALIG